MRAALARFGLTNAPNGILAATVPSCTVCAGGPVLTGPLAMAGLIGPAFVLHQLLWFFAPLNMVMLRLSYTVHRDPVPLVVGGLGSLLLVVHMASPYFLPAHPPDISLANPLRLISLGLTWLGSPLLIVGALLDWRARRRAGTCAAEDYWHTVLLGTNPGLRRGRHLFGLLPANPRCTLCNAPFRDNEVVTLVALTDPRGEQQSLPVVKVHLHCLRATEQQEAEWRAAILECESPARPWWQRWAWWRR